MDYDDLGFSFDIECFKEIGDQETTEEYNNILKELEYVILLRPLFSTNKSDAESFINSENKENLIGCSYFTPVMTFNPDEKESNAFYIPTTSLDGNPYSFLVPTRQEFLFKFNTENLSVNNAQVYLCGIEVILALKNNPASKFKLEYDTDIIISNMDLRLGKCAEDFEEGNNLIITSHIPLSYNVGGETFSENFPAISSVWVKKENDNITVMGKDSEDDDEEEETWYNLHWFKNVIDTEFKDQYLGYFWKEIPEIQHRYCFYQIQWQKVSNPSSSEKKKLYKDTRTSNDTADKRYRFTHNSYLTEGQKSMQSDYYKIISFTPILNNVNEKNWSPSVTEDTITGWFIKGNNKHSTSYLSLTDSYFTLNNGKSSGYIWQNYGNGIYSPIDFKDLNDNLFSFREKTLLEFKEFLETNNSIGNCYIYDEENKRFTFDLDSLDYFYADYDDEKTITSSNADNLQSYLLFYVPKYYDSEGNEYSLEDVFAALEENNSLSNCNLYYKSTDNSYKKITATKFIYLYPFEEKIFEATTWIEIKVPIRYTLNNQSLLYKYLSFNNDLDTTTIKAIVTDENGSIVVESNELEFSNKSVDRVAKNQMLDLIKDLTLTTSDGSGGKYYNYSKTGKNLNNLNSTSIKATFNFIKCGVSDWDNAPIKVKWELIDCKNTMVEGWVINSAVSEENNVEEIVFEKDALAEDLEQCTIGSSFSKEIESPKIKFKSTLINESSIPKIKCTIIRENGNDSIKDEATISLMFGRQGSSGTQYTFSIEPVEGKDKFYIDTSYGNKFVELKANLTNPEGVEINPSKIEWTIEKRGPRSKALNGNDTAQEAEGTNRSVVLNNEDTSNSDKYTQTDNFTDAVKIRTTKSGIFEIYHDTENSKKEIPILNKDSLKYISGTIIKATAYYEIDSEKTIAFVDYYAIPVSISKLFRSSSPSIIYYDHYGSLETPQISLDLSYNNTEVNDESLEDLNKLFTKSGKLESTIDRYQKGINEQSDRTFKDFLTSTKNFDEVLTKDKDFYSNQYWEDNIANNIKEVREKIEDAQKNKKLIVPDIFKNADGVNILVTLLTNFNTWKGSSPGKEIYEKSTWIKNLYETLQEIKTKADLNEAQKEYDATLGSIDDLLKKLPSTDLSKLQDGGYFWQVNTYLPDQNDWFENLDLSKWVNEKALLYYSPTISSMKSESTLQFPSNFINLPKETTIPNLILTCYKITELREAKSGETGSFTYNSKKYIVESTICWTQPLYYVQDSYGLGYINEWDGSMICDGEANRIMAATMVAGTKNNANQFTGVIMGEVKDSQSKIYSGISGYKQGKTSFGFSTDGTAFIGISDSRIEMDGENGILKLGSWQMRKSIFCTPSTRTSDESTGNYGVGIGAISADTADACAFYAGYKKTTATTTAVERIDTPWEAGKWKERTNFYVLNNGYLYAKNAHIEGDIVANSLDLTGTLNNGITKAIDGLITEKGYITVDSANDKYLNLELNYPKGSKKEDNTLMFKVERDGALIANNAIIKGTVYSEGGEIGPWHIGEKGIYRRRTANNYGTGMMSSTSATSVAFYAGYDGTTVTQEDGKFTKEGNPFDSPTNWKEKTDFYVLTDGTLYCSKATIEGFITATSGRIGHFTIAQAGSTTSCLMSQVGADFENDGTTFKGNRKYLYLRGSSSLRNSGAIIFGLRNAGRSDLINTPEIDDSNYTYDTNNKAGSASWLFLLNNTGTIGNSIAGKSSWSIEQNGRAIFGRNVQCRTLQLITDSINDNTGNYWPDVPKNGIALNGAERWIQILGNETTSLTQNSILLKADEDNTFLKLDCKNSKGNSNFQAIVRQPKNDDGEDTRCLLYRIDGVNKFYIPANSEHSLRFGRGDTPKVILYNTNAIGKGSHNLNIDNSNMRIAIDKQVFYIQIATGTDDEGKEVWKTLFKIEKNGKITGVGGTIYEPK